MNNWFIYLIRCYDNSLYTGITTDVERRFQEHQGKDNKGAKYLRGKGPLQLVWQHRVSNRSEASRHESVIKKLSKDNKLRLISGDMELLEAIDSGMAALPAHKKNRTV